MTSSAAIDRTRSRPLVVALCSVPLLCEGLAAHLEGVADVQAFPNTPGNVGAVLRWLRPNVVVVDSDETASLAAAFASEAEVSLVRVGLRDGTLRVWQDGDWVELGGDGLELEAVCDVLIAEIFRRGRRSS